MVLKFSIPDWQAWSPAQHDVQPDVSVIPAMLRRRLSPLGRAALSVILPLAETHGAMPLVYVSRHGDLHRTLGLLEELARAEPLSPTAFSLSVHNAVAGLFSIQQGLTRNITAISAGAGDLVPALLEALGLCSASEPKILCVCCDEPPPSFYHHQVDQPARPYALAMVISRGDDWELEQLDTHGQTPAIETGPQALQLLGLMQGGAGDLRIACNGGEWRVRRNMP